MFKKIMQSVKKVQDGVKPKTSGGRGLLARLAKQVAAKAKNSAASPPASGDRGFLGKIKGPFRFEQGGEADKTGRAMKKTDADAKGRAMPKAKGMMAGGMAKGMMAGGMMTKGYSAGGKVAAGKATRGYGAARRGS